MNGEEYRNRVMYCIYFLKKMWNTLSNEEKRDTDNYLCNITLKMYKSASYIWKDAGICQYIFDNLIKLSCSVDRNESNNILHFLSESYFLYVLCDGFNYKLQRLMDNRDLRYLVFMSDHYENEKMCAIIFSVIYSKCSYDLQRRMKIVIDRNMDIMHPMTIIRGVFTGAVNYSEKVRECIICEIEKGNFGDFENANEGNPVYLLAKLRVYGFIDRYEMEKFTDLCDKSIPLLFMIYPEYVLKSDLEAGWMFLAQTKEYRKYLKYSG